MSNFLSFIGGTLFGAYIAQNYDILNIKKASGELMNYVKKLEKDSKNDKDQSYNNSSNFILTNLDWGIFLKIYTLDWMEL